MLKFGVIFLLGAILLQVNGQENEEMFRWKIMAFSDAPRHHAYKVDGHDYYIKENNIPTGVTMYNNRVFISIARRNYGIPSTLNVIDIRSRAERQNKSPLLKGYPDYEKNELYETLKPDTERIISVYRTRADECGRLWFVDTGALEIDGSAHVINRPSIWVFDLRTDEKLRRFELPESIETDPRGLQSITVDAERLRCNDSFAYIPNSKNNHIIVYSFRDNDAWTVSDSSFKTDEKFTKLKIKGDEFEIDSGLYSIALGQRNIRERSRKVYYHSLSSFSEYLTQTKFLKNKTLSSKVDNESEFKLIGERGEATQSGMHDYDQRTRVLFFTMPQKNGIACWNTGKPMTPDNVALVAENETSLIYPADIKVDRFGMVWYLSNQQPILEKSHKIDENQFNFFVFRKSGRALIDRTVCQFGSLGVGSGSTTEKDNLRTDEVSGDEVSGDETYVPEDVVYDEID